MTCAKKNPNLTVRTYTHLSASKKRPAGPIGKTSMGPRSSSRDSSKKRTRDRTSSTGPLPRRRRHNTPRTRTTMSFTVSATAARAVASPAFVSKASSKVRFVSFRFVFFWRRRRSSLAGTADRRDGAGARRRRLGLLATASESRRRDVPGGWTDEGTRGATRGWIKNSSARRARRRCVASFGARDARVVMMDGWAHPSVRLGADTTMERHRRLTLRELAR